MGVLHSEPEAADDESCFGLWLECQRSWVILILSSPVPVELATQHMLNVGNPSVCVGCPVCVVYLQVICLFLET